MSSVQRGLSPGWSFLAGLFLGAIGALVPLTSAGHSRAASSDSGAATPVAAPRETSESVPLSMTPAPEINESTCDVQLD
jgi:hypothetical protein